MTIIVHCLWTWRHYLPRSKFMVKTDNVANSYFQSQKKLSLKQARWQEFLAEFDNDLGYKPRKANLVVDALSRKSKFAAMNKIQGEFLMLIKDEMECDPLGKQLISLVQQGKSKRFWVDDDLLYTKGQ